MSGDAVGKKARSAAQGGKKPAAQASSKAVAKAAGKSAKASAHPPPPDKALGWFERLKRLRLRFQRKGIDFKLLLEDPAEHIAAIKRQAVVVKSPEAVMMSAALKTVLDRHASARAVLPHLAVLEKGLNRHGLQALDELPPDVMLRAMSQLETLVTDWSQAGLAGLRARVTAALVRQDRASQRGGAPERLSDVQVDEASVSTFLAINAQWEGSLTGSQRLGGAPPAK